MAKYKEFQLPDFLYYDRKDHLWANVEEGKVRVGLDQVGQKAAGKIAYIKIRPVGSIVQKGRTFGSLEAGKYIGPLRAPVNGRIVEVNEEVLKNPSIVNEAPFDAWMVVIEPSSLEEDLKDLVHGEEVQAWLQEEVDRYEREGLFADTG